MDEIIDEKIKYDLTLDSELNKNIKLLRDESIVYKKICLLYTGPFILRRPGYVLLTNTRIIFLFHYVFKSDILRYIPLSQLSKVSYVSTPWWKMFKKVIRVEYDNKKIDFVIHIRQVKTGYGTYSEKETINFFELLKSKLV